MEVPRPKNLKAEEDRLHKAWERDDEGMCFRFYVEKYASKELLEFNKKYIARVKKNLKRRIIIN